MKTRPRNRPDRSPLLCLALCLGLWGCISTPLPDRGWSRIETEHFEILSTHGAEQSLRLAAELEQFRVAAEYLWGAPIPAVRHRALVLAYSRDGQERPFRRADAGKSYLVSGMERDILVLRSGLFESADDLSVALRLELARRLLWNASPRSLPPWLAEGLAQVASTTNARGSQVDVGTPRTDHIHTLHTQPWIPMDRLIGAAHLERWSSREREIFEAQTWALVHYLKTVERPSGQERDQVRAFLRELWRGTPSAAAARRVFGEHLQREARVHVRSREIESLVLKLPPPPRPAVAPADRHDVLVALGRLALALDEAALARGYFEAALEMDGASAPALAGLGEVLARLGDAAGARRASERAVELSPRDLEIQVARAEALRRAAQAAATSSERERLAELASDAYRHAAALGGGPATSYGLASARILVGDAVGAREAIERTRQTLPGDPAVRVLAARAALAAGDRDEARRLALAALTSARSRADLDAARALLAHIDSQAALH